MVRGFSEGVENSKQALKYPQTQTQTKKKTRAYAGDVNAFFAANVKTNKMRNSISKRYAPLSSS